MLYRQLLDQKAAPPTILNSGAKSPLTKAFVQLTLFLDQTNTITCLTAVRSEGLQLMPNIFKTNIKYNLNSGHPNPET